MPGAGVQPSLPCGRGMPFGGSISNVLHLSVVAYRKLRALRSKYLSARKSLSERQPEGFGWGVGEFVLSV